ncbi:MAG: hypothetical protein ACXVCP_13395 [Bdellovibrio sp.]
MAQKKWCYITVHPNVKVKVDKEDLERLEQHSWRITKGTSGRLRVVTSIRTPAGVRSLTMGKFLMKPTKGKQVYPRRFNEELNYCKDNLIVCTLKERQRLLPKNRKKSTSAFRGVSFIKSDDKWRAGIEVNGKAINLGNYKTEWEAALAYNKAALKYFGKLAYQNSIIKTEKRTKKKEE